MNTPIRPAGQAQDQQTNPWKVLALVFGGILVYEGVSYYWNRERGRYARRNPSHPAHWVRLDVSLPPPNRLDFHGFVPKWVRDAVMRPQASWKKHRLAMDFLKRETAKASKQNPSRKTFRIVENGVYLGTFAGETYDQARFAASQYYWTNEYVTLAEKAQEVEAKRARKNPRRAPSEHSAYAAFEMQEARAWAKTEEGKAHYEKLDRDMREFERRQRALSPAARRAQAKANRKAQEETDRKFKALPVLPVQSSSSLPWWPSR